MSVPVAMLEATIPLSTLVILLRVFFVISITGAVANDYLPFVKQATAYGKLASKSRYPLSSGQAFTLYYIIAFTWNALLLFCVARFLTTNHIPIVALPLEKVSHSSWLCANSVFPMLICRSDSFGALLVSFLLQLQFSRRLYECLRVHAFSNSPMTFIVHAAGTAYYMALCLCVLADSPLLHVASPSLVFSVDNARLHHFVGGLLFLYGSLQQFRCHRTLAALRSPANKGTYSIPRGGWFEYVSCPHYLAEVVLYCGLLITSGGRNLCLWLVVVWCVANLTVTARHTHAWYLAKFDNYKSLRRAAIFPGII